jgi:3-oxoacyl-[acyl-carrier-protein] synthase II
MSLSGLNLILGERLEILDRAKALSLSLVGAYQLAELANGVLAPSFGLMVCVDEEGFYGVALIERTDVRDGLFSGSSDLGKVGKL